MGNDPDLTMLTWKVANASATGTSHVLDDLPCQDFHVVDGDGSERLLLIAVADGAGSASLSDLGARTAASTAILALKKCAESIRDGDSARQAIEAAFVAARLAVEEQADLSEVAPRELATTLLVTVLGADLSVFGQVGDGAIVVGDFNALRVVHWPEQEALNVTDFIVGAPLQDTLTIVVENGAVHRVACMTDGITPLVLDQRTRRPHAPIMERLFSACADAPAEVDVNASLRAFLESDAVNERTDDDKTLVLAVCDGA